MRRIETAGYIAHSRTAVFRRRMEEAKNIIAEFLHIAENPYVAFSGGKDSSCLLFLVAEQKPNISARLLSSGETRLLHDNIDEVLNWWRERFPALDLVEINIDRVFADEWADADWATQRRAGRGDLANFLPASGEFDGVFLGLRNEESASRRLANLRGGAIRQYTENRNDACAGLWVACPLANWATTDVGAFIVAHQLPLLAEYERAGLEARTTARLTGDAARQNALQALRLRDPDGYNRLLQRFPELTWWAG